MQVLVNKVGEVNAQIVRQLIDKLVDLIRVLHEVEADVLLDLAE